jgi:Mg-chelatase subunit ChlD
LRDYTDITVLLDRSGSMSTIKDSMISGFDEFLTEHRKNPSTRISLVQFDGEQPYEAVYTALPVEDVPRLRLEPRGMTPLVDAMVLAVDNTGIRLAAMKEADRPSKVIFIAITDGGENSSHRFTRADVQKRLTTQTNNYNWQFVYLGANQDAFKEAGQLGFDHNKIANYAISAAGTKSAWRGLTSNTVSYANTGASSALDWTDLQKSAAEDKQPTTTGK